MISAGSVACGSVCLSAGAILLDLASHMLMGSDFNRPVPAAYVYEAAQRGGI